MKNIYKIFGMLVLVLVASLFFFQEKVFAIDTHCCVYYEGATPSNSCVFLSGDISTTVSCEGVARQIGYVPENIMGAYTISLSENCVPLSGYTSVKHLLSVGGQSTYDDWLCGAAQLVMNSAGSEGIRPSLEDAIAQSELASLQEKIIKLQQGTCCVPKLKVNTDDNKCHTPRIKEDTNSEDFFNDYNSGKILPDYFKYIDDIPLWDYLDCGEGDWYHFNISCSSPLIIGDQNQNLSIDLLKKETVMGGNRPNAFNMGSLIGSKFCSEAGGFCLCTTDKDGKKVCNPSFFNNINECNAARKGENNYICESVPLGTDCSVYSRDAGGLDYNLALDVKKLNPLGTSKITDVIGRIINTAMQIIGSIALAMFIYGGFLWMTGRGSAEKTKMAMQIMLWAALGIIVILGSYGLVDFVFEAF